MCDCSKRELFYLCLRPSHGYAVLSSSEDGKVIFASLLDRSFLNLIISVNELNDTFLIKNYFQRKKKKVKHYDTYKYKSIKQL